MEHERWVNNKLAAGWKYAPKTDKANKLHEDMISWEALEKRSEAANEKEDETAQEKDREFVRAIPGILAKAGYTVVKLRPVKAER